MNLYVVKALAVCSNWYSPKSAAIGGRMLQVIICCKIVSSNKLYCIYTLSFQGVSQEERWSICCSNGPSSMYYKRFVQFLQHWHLRFADMWQKWWSFLHWKAETSRQKGVFPQIDVNIGCKETKLLHVIICCEHYCNVKLDIP
jgi:hypothetical protein